MGTPVLKISIGPGAGATVGPRGIARRLGGASTPEFSLCVMLTDWHEYAECLDSFTARGFDATTCEFLVVDNSAGNRADAYVASNEFLQAASGQYVVLCHQDVLLLEQDIDALRGALAEVDRIDPHWGLCGNAGHDAQGYAAFNLVHPDGVAIVGKPFPKRVVSLDENFIVVRREANVALSRDLEGYHHYGVDLCIVADVLGWNAYVIDFFLRHKSMGTVDGRYLASRDRIAAKYRRAFRSRWIQVVTRSPLFLSGSVLATRAAPWRRKLGKLLGTVPRDRSLNRD
jgi:hypothetical protein